MDYDQPTLFIVAGPNGAGKSTHVKSLLPPGMENYIPFDRDKTRTEIEFKQFGTSKNLSQEQAISAISEMEKILMREMASAVAERKHFVLETPLSHPQYFRYIDYFTNKGYQVDLRYLGLSSVLESKRRVAFRVGQGGHDVPKNIIEGVFEMNLKNINDYRSTFQQINLYDGTVYPKLLLTLENENIINLNPEINNYSWIKSGLPSLLRVVINDQKRKNEIAEYLTLQPDDTKSKGLRR